MTYYPPDDLLRLFTSQTASDSAADDAAQQEEIRLRISADAELLAAARWRLHVALSVVPVIIGLATYLTLGVFSAGRTIISGYAEFIAERYWHFIVPGTVLAACVALSLAATIAFYLQTGFRRTTLFENARRNIMARINQELRRASHDNATGEPATLIDMTTSAPSKTSEPTPGPDSPYRQSLVFAADAETPVQVTNPVANPQSPNQLRNVSGTVTARASITLERLQRETDRLSWRGNLALIIGALVTITGIVALVLFVNGQPKFAISDQPWAFVDHFLPRLSLVILLEVFAYFFLKLYKDSLGDIKYFENEITNVESKTLALLVTIETEDVPTRSSVVTRFAETERNYVLKRGDTTPDLRRLELEKSEREAFLKQFTSILKTQFKMQDSEDKAADGGERGG